MGATTLRFRACVLAMLLAPCTAGAQSWDEPWSDPRDRPPRVDITFSAGMVAPTDWSDLVVLGSLSSISALEQVLVRDLRVEPDTIFDAAVTYWRDRYGLRVQGAFSRSSLTMGGDLDGGGRDVLATGVDTWFYDVRGVIGLVEYSPSRKALPYVFLGFGGITYNLEDTISPPLLTFIQGGNPTPGTPSTPVVIIDDDGGNQFLVAVDELGLETVPAFNFGAGVDFRIPTGGGGLGIRFEVADHMAKSPVGLRIRGGGVGGGLTQDDTVDFGAVHHLRATVGLVLQIGR